jgi:homoserine dehydrogenase
MKNDGFSYNEALSLAQQNGLAEPDPSADVSGFDAANKLSILLSLAMRTRIPIDNIFMEPITNITMQDIKYGQDMGLCLKYIAIGKRIGHNIEARVHPTFIPDTHPLASVNDSYNAVLITGDIVENLMFYGRGAGQFPTASALISDILNAASTPRGLHPVFTEEVSVQNNIIINKDWESEYFLRINLIDKPGMLARVAEIFGQCEISLAKVIQTEVNNSHASVVFLTHKAFESNIQKAIQMINSLPKTDCKFGCLIRVESNI